MCSSDLDRVSAEEALALGLTNWVCEPEELMDRTMEIAGRLASGPVVAYRYMKENLNRAMSGEVDDCLDLEATHHVHTGLTEDHKEAAKAFVEKREPSSRDARDCRTVQGNVIPGADKVVSFEVRQPGILVDGKTGRETLWFIQAAQCEINDLWMGLIDAGNRGAAIAAEVPGARLGGGQRPDFTADVPELVDRYHQPCHIGGPAGAPAHGAVTVGNRHVRGVSLGVEFVADGSAEAAASDSHGLSSL